MVLNIPLVIYISVFNIPEKPNYIVPTKAKAVEDKKESVIRNTFTEDPVEEAFSNEKLRRTL